MPRTKYTYNFKEKIVKEVMETGNMTLVARKHELSPTTIQQWVNNFKKYGVVSKKNAKINTTPSKSVLSNNNVYSKLEKENDMLKKLLGEKELDNLILKDLVKKTNPHSLKKLK